MVRVAASVVRGAAAGRQGSGNRANLNESLWKQEAQLAFNYLNQARTARGLKPITWNVQLQAAAERKGRYMGNLSQSWNDVDRPSQHTNMNRWAREAGYPLPDYMPNDANNIESTWAEGGTDLILSGAGQRLIDSFLSEGQGGGHYQAVMNPNAKDIAIAFATNSQGNAAFACVLVCQPSLNKDVCEVRRRIVAFALWSATTCRRFRVLECDDLSSLSHTARLERHRERW